ncbi:DMT family transporter [Loktanella sp. SALINAS62]|uniref:DMT family transporter n=1 Tax=Loktanella sp. SALINAS62 TaxID=2706124 RepID=UPI001B8AFF7F|nr:DMT family transporter [Loktanella sp. SALINAS62]MBS1303440.1 DMT family transporter [Loktanella sp. SALINAS62]
MALSDNMRGAALMAAGMTTFTINDAFVKTLSDSVPLFQVIFLRGIGVTIGLCLLAYALGQIRFDLTGRDWRLILIRSLAEAGGAALFITALFNMPIANVSAILQVLPLSVALAGALFLKEPLGWRRLSAILIGFVGVLLIVRPGGADFNVFSVSALAAVACVTLRDLVVRRMSRDVPSVMVSLVGSIVVTGVAGILTLFGDWAPLSADMTLPIGFATIALIVGYVCSVAAMRVGEIGFVAPFRYTSLLVALLIGLFVFQEIPRPVTLLGAGIVVATGLFTLWREQRIKLKRRVVPDRIR